MFSLQSLNKLLKDEIVKIIDSIDYVCLDIDGVLVYNKAPIPGAQDCVAKLRALGKRIGFVTNNSFYSKTLLKENLETFGATENEIVTPVDSLLIYLKKISFKKDIYVIGPLIVKKDLEKAGFNVKEYKDIWFGEIEESISGIEKVSLKTLEVCKNVGAVYVDVDFNFNLGAIQVAQVILTHKDDVLFLTGANDDMGNISETMKLVGPQFYIDGLERWVQRKSLTVAKPGLILKDVLESKFGIQDHSRVLFVGDNVNIDIGFGVNSEFQTCLVLSGVTSKNQVEEWNFPKNFKPMYVAENLGELYEKIKDL